MQHCPTSPAPHGPWAHGPVTPLSPSGGPYVHYIHAPGARPLQGGQGKDINRVFFGELFPSRLGLRAEISARFCPSFAPNCGVHLLCFHRNSYFYGRDNTQFYQKKINNIYIYVSDNTQNMPHPRNRLLDVPRRKIA